MTQPGDKPGQDDGDDHAADERPATTPTEADLDSEALGGDEPPAGQYGPTADFGDG